MLDEARVETLLAAPAAQDELMLSILSALPSGDRPEKGFGGSWVGSMDAKPAQSALLHRIAELLSGQGHGFAAWLNLLGNTKEAEALAEKHAKPCAILIDIPAEAFEDDYDQIEKSASTQPPTATSPTEKPIESASNTGDAAKTSTHTTLNQAKQPTPQSPVIPVVLVNAALLLLVFVIYLLIPQSTPTPWIKPSTAPPSTQR